MSHDIEKPSPFLIDEEHEKYWDEVKKKSWTSARTWTPGS